jgi:hypothetical protein
MESSITEATAPEPEATENAKSPEELAAEQALARATRPPEALGGPPTPPAPNPLPPGQQPEPEAESLHQPGYAARLAANRTEGDSILAVEDEGYQEARDNVLAGSKDEADLETVTEWLLSDDAEVNTRKLTVRLGGSDDRPVIAAWYIRAIGIDTIRSAEREASGAGKPQRRGQAQQYDELAANLRIVTEGTAAIGAPDGPDLKALAKQKGIADGVILLERRFRFRPGAIAQIAGEVMALSGFDQSDVQAAGN